METTIYSSEINRELLKRNGRITYLESLDAILKGRKYSL